MSCAAVAQKQLQMSEAAVEAQPVECSSVNLRLDVLHELEGDVGTARGRRGHQLAALPLPALLSWRDPPPISHAPSNAPRSHQHHTDLPWPVDAPSYQRNHLLHEATLHAGQRICRQVNQLELSGSNDSPCRDQGECNVNGAMSYQVGTQGTLCHPKAHMSNLPGLE
jgi:hypothetical protein